MKLDIADIQEYLSEHELDGWLMADFHARNSVALQQLSLPRFLTRRSFYYIPAFGEPTALVHAIEQDKFEHLPGRRLTYSSYKRLEEELGRVLRGQNRVAMEYSPMGRLPYIGLVDAGTIELVRSLNVEVVTSADLVAHFQARLSPEQIATHRIAAHNLHEIKEGAFAFIKERIIAGQPLCEYDVVRFILERFEEYDMETAFPPVCAVDRNAGNPHYEPSADGSDAIGRAQLVLIDLWARVKHPDGVYGDITWMGFTGTPAEIPAKHNEIFQILVQARDAAVAFVRDQVEIRPLKGYEVDDVCRKVIVDAGYGRFFTHRTGHSIAANEHGPGPNIDNIETEDRRRLQQGHLFSVEPGIYLPDCGFRTEIDVLIGHNGAEVTTLPMQTAIKALF